MDIFVRSDDFQVMPTNEGVVLCESYGAKIEVNDLVWATGGGATNTAACFVKQGLDTGLIAEIGTDIPGKILIDELKNLGISLDWLVTEPEEKTATSVILVAHQGGRSIVTYRGASKMLEVRDMPWENLQSEWLYISSLGGQLELLEALTYHAHDRNIKIAINPGGGEIDNPELIYKLAPYWQVLMVNETEGAKLAGIEETNLEVIGVRVKELGVEYTIVTAGEQGAILFKNDEKFFCPAGEEKAIESTGAGDAFGSGFVYGLIQDWGIEKSLQFAQANSAGVISKVGAKAGIIDEESFNNGPKAKIVKL